MGATLSAQNRPLRGTCPGIGEGRAYKQDKGFTPLVRASPPATRTRQSRVGKAKGAPEPHASNGVRDTPHCRYCGQMATPHVLLIIGASPSPATISHTRLTASS